MDTIYFRALFIFWLNKKFRKQQIGQVQKFFNHKHNTTHHNTTKQGQNVQSLCIRNWQRTIIKKMLFESESSRNKKWIQDLRRRHPITFLRNNNNIFAFCMCH